MVLNYTTILFSEYQLILAGKLSIECKFVFEFKIGIPKIIAYICSSFIYT